MALQDVFAENVKRRLRELGKTQNWLADRLGVSKVTVSKVVNKKFAPTLPLVETYAASLDTTPQYLLTPSTPEHEKMPSLG